MYTKNHSPLLFILSSVLIHALVFLCLSLSFQILSEKTQFSFIESKKSSIIGKINVAQIKTEVPKKKVRPPKEIQKKGPKKKIVKKKIKRTSKSSSAKGVKSLGKKNILAKYLSKVRKEMAKYKYKSRMAKRLNLKGKVQLSFDLVYPNMIKNIKVHNPSKYQTLNQSALLSIKKVESLPSFPKDINKKIIPSIIYTMVYE